MSCRLFIPPQSLKRGSLSITGDDHHYLFRVRRLTVGDQVTVFDGDGREAEARVQSISGASARLTIEEIGAATAKHTPAITVLPALIKGDRFDWSLAKLVELGADTIVPVETDRSVVKLLDAPERAKSRRQRFETRARAAARQCQSAIVPPVAPITDFAGALELTADIELKLLFFEGANAVPLSSSLPESPPASIAIMVGPEGGFSDEEVELALAAGYKTVGLGPRILRSETASVAALAVVGYALGDLGASGGQDS